MSDNNQTQQPGMPTPDPSLKALDKFVGKWHMSGHLVNSDEETIKGEVEFGWLPGNFFFTQHFHLDFNGLKIESTEFVGFDPETNGLKSAVYSNLSPVPLPYFWKVDGNKLEIKVNYGPMDSTFHGELSEDGQTFSGSWRPNPGADTNVNVAYDISGTRKK